MKETIGFRPRGDDAVIITFGTAINEETNQAIRRFLFAIEKNGIKGMIEAIPSYTQLTIIYDQQECYYEEMLDQLYEIRRQLTSIEIPEAQTVKIPVVYGGEFGPDLATVAKYNGLSEEEVVTIHTSENYLIYMLGFTPGFPYLGGMDQKIATPRLETPREKIWAGSVGIAGNQTGIYPIESPGGWQIIGRTPLKLFDRDRSPEILLKAGDYIAFYPISEKEYLEMGGTL